MFEGWSYSQVLRAIGQSLEERGVQEFTLAWQDGEFVVRGRRGLPLERHWVDKVLGQKAVQTERTFEIHYPVKSVVWLQIRGESMRKDANQIPDYFRLSQTLRTVGSYIENRGMPILSLRRRRFDHAVRTEHAIEHILVCAHHHVDECGALGDLDHVGDRAKSQLASIRQRWRAGVIADDIGDTSELEPL